MSDRTESYASRQQSQREEITVITTHVDRQQDKYEGILPSNVSWADFRNAFLIAVQMNPRLLEADRQSLWLALQKAASAGLKPDGREGALVIYGDDAEDEDGNRVPTAAKGKKKVVWMPMIFGLIKVVRNTGNVASVRARLIYRGEHLLMSDVDGKETYKHVKSIGTDTDVDDSPANIVGAYAVVAFKDGSWEIEPMTRQQIDRVRSVSRAKKGPWGPWYDEMAKKTVLRRLIKRLDQSSELRRLDAALANDESLGIEIEGEKPIEIEAPAAAIKSEFSAAKQAASKKPSPSDVGGGSSPPADKSRVAPSVSDAGSEHPHSEQDGVTSLAAKPRVGPSAPASDSGQTNQPPPADEEPPFPGDTIEAPEIWPYDEFGEMPDGMSEPMSERQFADWFAAALFKSPNPDALIEHNQDNIGATVRDAEAAGIVQAALDRHRKRKVDSLTAQNQSNQPPPAPAAPPPAEKPKRKPIALGKTPKGSPHWPNYGDAAKAEISALMSEADIDDWIATNKPTYAGGAVEIAIDNRISKRREFLRPVAAATDPTLVLEGIHSTVLTITSIEQIIEWSKKPETAAMWAALKAAGGDFYAKGVEILDNRRVQLE